MKPKLNFKGAVVGFVAMGALALSANAQAVTVDAGIFTAGNGDAAHPIHITVPQTSSLFLDTITFDLGSFTAFNMTSTPTNISFFGASIFENAHDTEVNTPGGIVQSPNYPGYSATFTAVLLPDLGFTRDYHLHPQGLVANGGGSYDLTLWGSVAPVPIPAAVYLFGTGVIGLVAMARRRPSAMS